MIRKKIFLFTLLLGMFSSAYSQVGVYLTEDFESGILNPDYNLNCYDWTHGNFTIQTNVTRKGNYAARFINKVNEGKRCEMTFRQPGFFDWGEEVWQGFSINIPNLPSSNAVLSQHHSVPGPIGDADWSFASGGNGFTIRLSGDQTKLDLRLIPPGDASLNFYINATPEKPMPGSSAAGTEIYYSWPLQLNKWFDVVLNFRYSDGSDGFYKVWINGVKVIDITGSNVHLHDVAGRLKERKNYMQFGVYPLTAGHAEIFYDEMRLGDETSSYIDVAPEITPAVIPSSLTVSDKTSNSISIAWEMSKDYVNDIQYDVYRDGTLIDTVTTKYYTDTLLSGATSYSYAVAARDILGNETAQSEAVEGTILQSQEISITPIADKINKEAPFDVSAIVTSGLPLTYEVSGPATISGKTITLSGSPGKVEVTVTQAGDAAYSKTSESTSFEVILITSLPAHAAGVAGGQAGIEEELSTLKIYPIPATDWLKIDGDYTENAMVQVVDVIGKQVLFQAFSNNSISVRDLPEGTYILNLTDKGVTFKGKIIIQR